MLPTKSHRDGYFNLEKFGALLSELVFEHLTDKQIAAAFANVYGFIKSGGYFIIAVPDGYHPGKEYIEMVKPGGHGAGSIDNKQLFNCQTLSAQLEKAGFEVRLLEWFDERGNFNFLDWTGRDGFISRSSRYDERNVNSPLAYTSLILDACRI